MAERESTEGAAFGLAALWREAEQVEYLDRKGVLRQVFLDSLNSFWLSPITAGLSLISIAAALFLFGVFLLVFQNVYAQLLNSAAQQTISVYILDTISDEAKSALIDEVTALEEVAEVQFWSKDIALQEFGKIFSEFPEMRAGLEMDNPLPASLELSLKEELSYESYRGLVQRLREKSGVVHVGFQHELLEQLSGLLSFMGRTGAAVVIVILLITGFVIASTVRLALFLRQTELSIMRLVGASAWYIRGPCLIEGMLYGLVGGILSLLLLAAFYVTLATSMQSVAALTVLAGNLSFLSFGRCILVLFVGIAVGIGASYFASRKAVNE